MRGDWAIDPIKTYWLGVFIGFVGGVLTTLSAVW